MDCGPCPIVSDAEQCGFVPNACYAVSLQRRVSVNGLPVAIQSSKGIDTTPVIFYGSELEVARAVICAAVIKPRLGEWFNDIVEAVGRERAVDSFAAVGPADHERVDHG